MVVNPILRHFTNDEFPHHVVRLHGYMATWLPEIFRIENWLYSCLTATQCGFTLYQWVSNPIQVRASQVIRTKVQSWRLTKLFLSGLPGYSLLLGVRTANIVDWSHLKIYLLFFIDVSLPRFVLVHLNFCLCLIQIFIQMLIVFFCICEALCSPCFEKCYSNKVVLFIQQPVNSVSTVVMTYQGFLFYFNYFIKVRTGP